MQKLTGLIAATYTPMHDDGSLKLETVDILAERLVTDGVNGAFLCGTTGEFASLTLDERKRVCERWTSVRDGDFRIVPHVGGTSVPESRELAAHAQANGADAIACIAPFFFRPTTTEDLVAYCVDVASAAPDLPFYFYHLPALTGVLLPMAEFLRLGAESIPTLAGVKFSHVDLADFAECLSLDHRRFDVLFGCDEMLLAALAFGCAGAVGTTYGFAAPLFNSIIESFASGDLATARRLQTRCVEMVNIFVRLGGHRAMKATMKISGIDCGPVRSPMRPLTYDELTVLSAELAAIGFGEYRRDAVSDRSA